MTEKSLARIKSVMQTLRAAMDEIAAVMSLEDEAYNSLADDDIDRRLANDIAYSRLYDSQEAINTAFAGLESLDDRR